MTKKPDQEDLSQIEKASKLIEALVGADNELPLSIWMLVFMNHTAKMGAFSGMSFEDFEALVEDFMDFFRTNWGNLQKMQKKDEE